MYEFELDFHFGLDDSICVSEAGGKRFFLPKSQIIMDENDPDQEDVISVSIPEWLAIDRGLL